MVKLRDNSAFIFFTHTTCSIWKIHIAFWNTLLSSPWYLQLLSLLSLWISGWKYIIVFAFPYMACPTSNVATILPLWIVLNYPISTYYRNSIVCTVDMEMVYFVIGLRLPERQNTIDAVFNIRNNLIVVERRTKKVLQNIEIKKNLRKGTVNNRSYIIYFVIFCIYFKIYNLEKSDHKVWFFLLSCMFS